MATHVVGTLDTEQDRQRIMEEMVAEHGPGWREHYKPGTFGCHELLDRTSLAARAIEENVLSHPACAQNPEWFALAEQAAAALHELYQRIGTEHVGEESAENSKP